jgi:hypothetical protein
LPPSRETYKGRNIVVEEPEDEARLAEAKPSISIDDQRVNVIQNPDGTYSSEGLYYTKYASLPELARAIIDSYPREDEPLSG